LDPELIWVSDVELYYRLQDLHGAPLIVPDTLVCIRHWEHQVTNTVAATVERRRRELDYAFRKHGLEAPLDTPIANPSLRDGFRERLPDGALAAWREWRRAIRT